MALAMGIEITNREKNTNCLIYANDGDVIIDSFFIKDDSFNLLNARMDRRLNTIMIVERITNFSPFYKIFFYFYLIMFGNDYVNKVLSGTTIQIYRWKMIIEITIKLLNDDVLKDQLDIMAH